ncbi:unnamed protein product [Dicrocoelium dendriticum]|nr:unnamed protein product [Dicrocoelium dendriticum]
MDSAELVDTDDETGDPECNSGDSLEYSFAPHKRSSCHDGRTRKLHLQKRAKNNGKRSLRKRISAHTRQRSHQFRDTKRHTINASGVEYGASEPQSPIGRSQFESNHEFECTSTPLTKSSEDASNRLAAPVTAIASTAIQVDSQTNLGCLQIVTSPKNQTSRDGDHSTTKQPEDFVKTPVHTDPHKRARKFLYHLAPLLKMTLPSRIERKRTQIVFDAHSRPDRITGSGVRSSFCERQWTKHGLYLQHCLTFVDSDPNSPSPLLGHTGSSRIAMNADLYVQRLWRELQLRIHGSSVTNMLDLRIPQTKTLIHEIAAFSLRSPSRSFRRRSAVSQESRRTLEGYWEYVMLANVSVSQLLTRVEQVEQAWSSEARFVYNVIDWALPEVKSRLTYLNQWSSRLAILLRGLGQVCAFLHQSYTSPCPVHKDPRTFRVPVPSLTSCPLYAGGPSEQLKQLYDHFLRHSWHLPPVIESSSSYTERHPQQGIHPVVAVHEPVTTCGTFSVALLRLDRLTQRILAEVNGGSQFFDPPELNRKRDRSAQRHPHSSSAHLSTACTQTEPLQPVTAANPSMKDPQDHADVRLSPTATTPLSSPASHARTDLMTPLSRCTCSRSPATCSEHGRRTAVNAWLRNLLRKHAPSRAQSYASVVKRQSWCGLLSVVADPLSVRRSPDCPPTGVIESNLFVDRPPVNWEICSPTQSPSSLAYSSFSSSSSPTPPSMRLSAGDASTSSSEFGSHHDSDSSSSSSPSSILQVPYSAIASTSASDLSCTSLLSVDLRDYWSLSNLTEAEFHWLDSTSMLSEHDDSLRMFLPTLVPLWLCLARIPFDVTRAAVALKLQQYTDRVSTNSQPNPLNLAHLVMELRELLNASVEIVLEYRKRLLTATKLNTAAQPRVAFRWFNRHGSFLDTQQLLESDSAPDVTTHADEVRTEIHTNSQREKPAVSRPRWFCKATGQARQFLDGSALDSLFNVPQLLETYVDCFIRLLTVKRSAGDGTASELRSQVQEEWDFLRRIYRKLHRCRGGLHYAVLSNSHTTLASQTGLRSAESAFVRGVRRFTCFLAEYLSPLIGDSIPSAMTATSNPLRPNRSTNSVTDGWVTAIDSPESTENHTSPLSNYDGLEKEPTDLAEQATWGSAHSSIKSASAGGRVECYQEFSEMWREKRSWLNCLLDLTGLLCADLDTAALLYFGFRVKPRASTDEHQKEVGIIRRMRAQRKLVRELRQTGHVLLYSWDHESSTEREVSYDCGCIFILSPVLQPKTLYEALPNAQPSTLRSPDRVAGDNLKHADTKCRGLVIPSTEERRAVRKHVSSFVHRMSNQLIFKPRKPHTCSFSYDQDSPTDVMQPRWSTSHTDRPCQTGSTLEARYSQGADVRQYRSLEHAHAEYLLVCPAVSPKIWDGLSYNFGRSANVIRTNTGRRMWFGLRWIEVMCFHSSRKHFEDESDGPILIPCWLLADRLHSAWTSIRESSVRLRRFLSVGISSTLPGGLHDPAFSSTSPTMLHAALQLAPIQPTLNASVTMLRKSLCDLAAQLQGSLLVMESHLRSYDSTMIPELNTSPLTDPLHSAFRGLRPASCSPRTTVSASRASSAQHPLISDTVQRAYSVVFAFYKTLMRLMLTAPTRAAILFDDEGTSVDPSVSIQTRLISLGVQLLINWSDFVTVTYPRGRGRIPRWANDACHFAYQLCQGRSVRFLDVKTVSSLEATLNYFIPYLVGEEGPQETRASPTSPSLAASALAHHAVYTRHCSSFAGRAAVTEPARRFRRVHSLHGSSYSRRPMCLTDPRQMSARMWRLPRQVDALHVSEASAHQPRASTRTKSIAQLEANRDARLRRSGMIGRSLASQETSETKEPTNQGTNASHHVEEAGDSMKPEPLQVTLGQRHFPFTWNRGRLIGRGVTGKVFQAYNLQTQEMMAVKEVLYDYAWESKGIMVDDGKHRDAMERLNAFRRECDLLGSLSHPALVRFLGADERTPKVLRLFTELCNAGTLADIAREHPSEALVRRYARDLARAIAYLHERGIVHRDIKPANIFLVGPAKCAADSTSSSPLRHGPNPYSSPGSPAHGQCLLKLGDFSHSLRLHSLSSTARGAAGTVCYMAPEVCRDLESGYGRPCDIWSFCCVLLELLTGKPPWHEVADVYAVFFKLCHNQLPTLPTVFPQALQYSRSPASASSSTTTEPTYASKEAVALLQAGITADPDERPTATDLFQFDFIQCPVSNTTDQ